MKSYYLRKSKSLLTGICAMAVLLLLAVNARAQQTNLIANTNTVLKPANGFNNLQVVASPPTYDAITGLIVTNPTFQNLTHVVNDLDTDASTWSPLLGGSKFLEVRDNDATGTNKYPAGSYAGFVIGTGDIISAGSTIELAVYDDDTQVGSSYTVPQNQLLGLALLGVQKTMVGFHTTGQFNRIRVTFSVAGVLPTRSVYYAVVKKYQAPQSNAYACNTPTPLANPAFPVSINYDRTGTTGINLGENVSNIESILDPSSTSFASFNALVSVSGTAFVSVKSHAGTFANTDPVYVGFDLESSTLLNLNTSILSTIQIRTYITGNPNPVQTMTGDQLLLSAGVLSSTRRTIGFLATAEFDEVQLVLTTGLANALGETKVFNARIARFCPPPSPSCNTLEAFTNSRYPVIISNENTGITGAIGANNSIDNVSGVISSSPTEYATINQTLSAVTTASIAVQDVLSTYPAGTYAGFVIETQQLVSVEALSAATVTLYNNGNEVQSGTGNALLLGGQTFIGGVQPKQTIGIVATDEFDEVKISFTNLVGLSLGEIRVYNAVIQDNCDPFELECNSSYELNAPTHGVVIEGTRTGVEGAASIDAYVENAWNVITPSSTDFARIRNIVGGLTQASISVANGVDTYPAGTFAGFAIKRESGIVEADLLSYISISTYNNGILQERRTSGSLLNLSILINLFGTPDGFFYPGFYATLPFDEIRISVGNLLNANVLTGYIDVYGAFVDTRQSSGGDLSCRLITNPDINVAYINVETSGDVSTNDINDTGAPITYGPVTAGSGNPDDGTTLPVLNTNGLGGYTFTGTVPGVYTFEIPACKDGQVAANNECKIETLTLTLLDPGSSTNAPVVNPDIAAITGAESSPASTTINVLANDGPGNAGGVLGTPTIHTAPSNGNATIDGSGNVIYTPNAGFYGDDFFTYQVCEGEGATQQCGSAQVKVSVFHPGAGGVVYASDDFNATLKNTALTGSLSVLSNDKDSKGSPLTASRESGAAYFVSLSEEGTLSLNSDGTYTYTPDTDYTGTTSFVYEACNGTGGCASATLYLSVSPSDPLPVSLSRFTVVKEGDNAQLSWSTTEELNSDRFEVQRSFEAKTWHPLDVVSASGNSSIIRNYSFTDVDPLEGVNYYRLKMIDKDGTFKYSPIESLKFDNLSAISISPNPAAEKVSVKFKDIKTVEKVELLSVTGKVIHRLTSGSISNEINIRNLPAGMYIISVTRTGGRVTTHKLMKN